MKVKNVRLDGDPERGGALLIAIIATMVLAGMAAAMMAVSGSSQNESMASVERMRALYVAEAGLSEAILDVNRNGADEDLWGSPTKTWGSYGTPNFSSGGHWGGMEINADGSVTITSSGISHGESRAVEAVIVPPAGGIYSNALFAGNRDRDPNYDLEFGGDGTQADEIVGDVYSGANIVRSGDSRIHGVSRATGSISGGAGESGVEQPLPDIAGMDYPNNHDVDVAAAFSSAAWRSNALGGSAWEVPEADPAHIFRLNPSDRTSDTSLTDKDDFFLEDPYEPVRVDPRSNGTDASHITFSGVGGSPGPDGNSLVYFVDGNLWLHNKKSYSFKIYNGGTGTGMQVTIVVRGNIYFSDNLFYQNKNRDGVAFIAIEDEKVKDSGNIYFGDPVFGTLEHMDAFMYAENDFYDTNLSASGSAVVSVRGNMTAGNQVLIERDYRGQHAKLAVEFDDRIMTGSLVLPGLPGVGGSGAGWAMVSWREVPVQ